MFYPFIVPENYAYIVSNIGCIMYITKLFDSIHVILNKQRTHGQKSFLFYVGYSEIRYQYSYYIQYIL